MWVRTMEERRRTPGWLALGIAYTIVSVGGMVAFLVFTDGIVRWVGATVMAFFAGQVFELAALAWKEIRRWAPLRSAEDERR